MKQSTNLIKGLSESVNELCTNALKIISFGFVFAGVNIILQGRTDGRQRSAIRSIWAFTGSTGRIFLRSGRMLWQSAQMSVEEAGWRKEKLLSTLLNMV